MILGFQSNVGFPSSQTYQIHGSWLRCPMDSTSLTGCFDHFFWFAFAQHSSLQGKPCKSSSKQFAINLQYSLISAIARINMLSESCSRSLANKIDFCTNWSDVVMVILLGQKAPGGWNNTIILGKLRNNFTSYLCRIYFSMFIHVYFEQLSECLGSLNVCNLARPFPFCSSVAIFHG